MPALQPENLDQMLEKRERKTQCWGFGDLLDTPLNLESFIKGKHNY